MRLIILFFSSLFPFFVYSSSCVSGNNSMITFPPDTFNVPASLCRSGCQLVRYDPTSPPVCNANECFTVYVSTANTCDGDSGGDGGDGNVNDGSDKPHYNYQDIRFKPLSLPPPHITEKNFGLAETLKHNSDVLVNQTQHLRVEIRDQTARLNNQSGVLIRNVIEQTDSIGNMYRSFSDMGTEMARLNDTTFKFSQNFLHTQGAQQEYFDAFNDLLSLQSETNLSIQNSANQNYSHVGRIADTIDNLRSNSASSSDINNAASRIDSALWQALSSQTMSLQPMLGDINQSQFEANNKLSDLIVAINDGFQSLSDGDDSGGDGSGSGSVDFSGLESGLSQLNDSASGIYNALTDSPSFLTPESNPDRHSGLSRPILDGVETLQSDISDLQDKLADLLSNPPVNIGVMSFNNGSYEPISFELDKYGRSVSFNLFNSLGAENMNLIRSVITFMALFSSTILILTAGRGR